MDLPPESIPDDWTTDPAEINFDLIWKGPESDGQKMARRFDLPNPQVIMTSKRETGVPEAMFKSDNQYYIWDQMDNTVWQITKPVGLMSILHAMVTKGQKALKGKELKAVRAWEYADSECNDKHLAPHKVIARGVSKMTENILTAFNGQLNLRIAYTYTLNQIYNFLADVVNQPGFYGITINDISELVLIRGEILRLSLPRGEEYDAAALRPRQHIHRAINPRWSATNRTRVSKFTLLRYQHDGVSFWSATDLLGLFLSRTGSAPTGATKRNFYLPLTAVYGKWCSKLIRTDPPFVVQCTWREAPGERARFFLGASMAGHEIDTVETGAWGHVLNRARYNVICFELLKLKGWSQRVSPDIQAWGGKRGKQFGRCGETYHLRFLLCGQEAPERVYGLALSKWSLSAPVYDDRLSGKTWANLWDPCLNCKEVIRMWNGDTNHFVKWYGSDGAPQ